MMCVQRPTHSTALLLLVAAQELGPVHGDRHAHLGKTRSIPLQVRHGRIVLDADAVPLRRGLGLRAPQRGDGVGLAQRPLDAFFYDILSVDWGTRDEDGGSLSGRTARGQFLAVYYTYCRL